MFQYTAHNWNNQPALQVWWNERCEVSAAELHFDSSFQGYPTCHYWSHMARWPDGHKWPFWPYLAIYGYLAINEKSYKNVAQQ